VNTSVASSHAAEKEGEGYKWSQDGDDLEISVEVEADVTKKDLKISFGQEKISVKVKGDTKVELTLFDKIRPDECNWTLSKGKVSLAAYTATHCNTLQHTATHCNTLQHTATHCNILNCRVTLSPPRSSLPRALSFLFVCSFMCWPVRLFVSQTLSRTMYLS